MLVTWKHQTASLALVLTGRTGLVIGGMLSGVALFVGACVGGVWLYQHAEYHGLFWSVLPWLLGLAVLLKLLAANWAGRELLRRGILNRFTAVRLLVGWLAVAAAFGGGLCWLI